MAVHPTTTQWQRSFENPFCCLLPLRYYVYVFVYGPSRFPSSLIVTWPRGPPMTSSQGLRKWLQRLRWPRDRQSTGIGALPQNSRKAGLPPTIRLGRQWASDCISSASSLARQLIKRQFINKCIRENEKRAMLCGIAMGTHARTHLYLYSQSAFKCFSRWKP
jgi:hypothetical protein